MGRRNVGQVILALASLLLAGRLDAQQVHRNGFEGVRPSWAKGASDADFQEQAHTITDEVMHDGRHSEHLKLNAKAGSFIHYQYPVDKAPIGEELSAGVWVKANRPGVQLLARLVLPNAPDPNNLEHRMTTVVQGEAYQKVGQWQRLSLPRPTQLVKKHQQVMQAQLNRTVNFEGAYLDVLMLNVYTGPGPLELWIDDLDIGPVYRDSVFQPAVRPGSSGTAAQPTSIPRKSDRIVEFANNHLVVSNKRMVFRAVRHSDTPLRVLRDAGFNTICFDSNVREDVLKEAAELGLWVVPQLRIAADDGKPLPPDAIQRDLQRYGAIERTLFYRLGDLFTAEQASMVAKAGAVVRGADPGRPIAVDAVDGLMPYSRGVNLVGVHRWPLMTSLEIPKYREWLDLRRRLATPGAFLWTWIQTQMPDSLAQTLYGRSASAGIQEPIGPQAEQVRLLTYTALAAGCRGLAFGSDRFLADSHQGRDRLLCCGLINQEIEMIEPLLVTVEDAPEWIDTSVPEVKAAVLRCAKGVLVLPIWQGGFAQHVPGQAAVNKLSITVPQIPQSTQAWEISPGDVRGLRAERVVGGSKITLPEFGVTSIVLFTSDTDLVGRFQEQVRVKRQTAALWTYDMASYELDKVQTVHQQLEAMGKTIPEANSLLEDARKRLAASKELFDNRVFGEAYREGQRALRPLRILMRAEWEQAVRGLDAPVAMPYSVSYFTLAKHWQMQDEVRRSTPAANLLPSGDFEDVPGREGPAWQADKRIQQLDEVDVHSERVSAMTPPKDAENDARLKQSPFYFSMTPKEGSRCAMLQVRPRPGQPIPQALERTYVAVNSPTVKATPGSYVQISAQIYIPKNITGSADGALFFDSAGGEPLALRLTAAANWKKFTLYRRVPESGQIQVTIALTGVGTVFFDDVRIEPLAQGNTSASTLAR